MKKLAFLLIFLLACRPPTAAPTDLELKRARNAEAEGRFDWARLHYRADREQHPERLESLRGEGLAWLSGYQQSWSEGTGLLAQALARENDALLRRRLVATLVQLGDIEAATKAAQGLEMDAEGLVLLARLERGRDLEVARKRVDEALALDSKVQGGAALAAELADEAGAVDQAELQATRALALDPLDAGSLYLRARQLRAKGDAEAARRLLARLEKVRQIRHDGTAPPLPPTEALPIFAALAAELDHLPKSFRLTWIEALLVAGEAEKALAQIDALLTQADLDARELAKLATQLHGAGRVARARQLFEAVLKQAPDEAGAAASLAQIDLEQGRLSEARRRLETELAKRPDFARLHLLLGRLYRAEDRAEEARQSFEKALELAPFMASWRVELADLLLILGQEDEVAKLLAAAPESTPELDRLRR